jgi:hypothetical protein
MPVSESSAMHQLRPDWLRRHSWILIADRMPKEHYAALALSPIRLNVVDMPKPWSQMSHCTKLGDYCALIGDCVRPYVVSHLNAKRHNWQWAGFNRRLRASVRSLPFKCKATQLAMGGIYFFHEKSCNVHGIVGLLIKCNWFAKPQFNATNRSLFSKSPNFVQRDSSATCSCSLALIAIWFKQFSFVIGCRATSTLRTLSAERPARSANAR